MHGLTRSPYPQAGDGANAFRMSSAQAEPTLRSADALLSAGLIDPAARDAVAAVEQRYAIAVSPAMRALIQHADDPIGRQFVPDPVELITAAA